MFLSLILTGIQYVLLIWLLWSNTWMVKNPFWMGLQISGIAVGLWAIFEMQKSKLNIAPHVRKGAILISSGPYRVIRHPMYLSLLLFFLPMISVNQSLTFLVVLFIFITNPLVSH
jgi:protein-S-isoprenylcysteine O-methyltransferase Ste14